MSVAITIKNDRRKSDVLALILLIQPIRIARFGQLNPSGYAGPVMCHYAGERGAGRPFTCVILIKINKINDIVVGFGGAAAYVNTISTIMAHPTAT